MNVSGSCAKVPGPSARLLRPSTSTSVLLPIFALRRTTAERGSCQQPTIGRIESTTMMMAAWVAFTESSQGKRIPPVTFPRTRYCGTADSHPAPPPCLAVVAFRRMLPPPGRQVPEQEGRRGAAGSSGRIRRRQLRTSSFSSRQLHSPPPSNPQISSVNKGQQQEELTAAPPRLRVRGVLFIRFELK